MTEVITSDLHLGHKNIIKLCPSTRPFGDLDEMDEVILEEMNKYLRNPQVSRFFFLGDLILRSKRHAEKYLEKIVNPEKVFMIEGNHDRHLINLYREVFGTVTPYYEKTYKRDGGKIKVCMMHYPLETWNMRNYGSIHLHGHSHGPAYTTGPRRRDVGYDASPFGICDIQKHIEHALQDEIIKNHHQYE